MEARIRGAMRLAEAGIRAARSILIAVVVGALVSQIFFVADRLENICAYNACTSGFNVFGPPKDLGVLAAILVAPALFLTPLPAEGRVALAGIRALFVGALLAWLSSTLSGATERVADPQVRAMAIGGLAAVGLFLYAFGPQRGVGRKPDAPALAATPSFEPFKG